MSYSSLPLPEADPTSIHTNPNHERKKVEKVLELYGASEFVCEKIGAWYVKGWPPLDYTDTFSPTARYDSIRILLALAVQQDLKIKQFDVKTAFLNGDLHDEVYMFPPEGIEASDGMVCKLRKALYGLKQTSRQWNERFDGFLKSIGFHQSNADKCIYHGRFNDSKILLALYRVSQNSFKSGKWEVP